VPWLRIFSCICLAAAVLLQVVLRNVSVNYVDPSDIDSPEQYNAKVRY
jgi:hypothetical protein